MQTLTLDYATQEWCLLETMKRDPCLYFHLQSSGFANEEARALLNWAWFDKKKPNEDLIYFVRSVYLPTRRIQIRRKVPTFVRNPRIPSCPDISHNAWMAALGLSLLVTVPND